MEVTKVLLAAFLTLTLISTALSRPSGSASSELTDIASELTHALSELVDLMAEDRSSRRRRFVQYHIGRAHHRPESYHRSRLNRRGRGYPSQYGGGRNADISDH